MPEKIIAGNRDDLCLDRSRCLRVRFNGSDCSHCQAVCPTAAIALEQGLKLDSERCTGCLLCTSVCPTGALELSADFLACVAQLSKVPEPVLGCCRTKEQANGWLACLGGLSDEHLLYLTHHLSGTLILNLSRCTECPNNSMLPFLQVRLATITAGGSCIIKAVDTAEAVRHRDENVDRRSFFKSFRSSLFQTAAVVMTAGAQETERRSDYTAKRVPARRELLKRIEKKVDQAKRNDLENRFSGRVIFAETCSACQACAAVCPTGALRKNHEHPDNAPIFTATDCTSCGLCVEFCQDHGCCFSDPARAIPHTQEPDTNRLS